MGASGANGCSKRGESSRRSPCVVTGWVSRGRELTPQLRVATLAWMFRRTADPPPDELPDDAPPDRATDPTANRPTEPDLATLPIAGITRRRVAMGIGALLAAWVVVIFARQVSEAAAASARAEAMI